MAKKYIIYRKFAFTLPPRQVTAVSKMLNYAGIPTSPEIWVGSKLVLALLAGIIGALIPFTIFRFAGVFGLSFTDATTSDVILMLGMSFATGALLFATVAILFYLHLYYIIHDRTHRVEAILPDFLLMVAANLRAGLTPFSALQVAARPEFGPLEAEVRIISSRSMGTESFTDALRKLTDRVDSNVLRRTINFFENGLKSGGKLAQLLETSADEIREMDELKREMMLNTKTYAIFLIFILIFGLPLLLAISTEFLGTFTKIQSQLSTDDLKGVSAISAPKISIDVGFINQMAGVIIIGTSILISILVGVISEGKILYGLKYAVPLSIASGTMFMICKMMIGGFIGQLI
jgi:pilus assembly protein TadC